MQASPAASVGPLQRAKGDLPARLFIARSRKGNEQMLARIRKAQEEREGGFTLIELLVVIIIIGILAAIAIPVFLNQRNKGYDAQSKSDLRNMATAIGNPASLICSMKCSRPATVFGAGIESFKIASLSAP